MKYLFFDIECCDGEHICEFGYILTNDKFQILERDLILINPNKKFYLKGRPGQRDIKLYFTEQQYNNSPLFSTYYERIKNIIQSPDQKVIGHAIINDAKFLRTACEEYNLPPINFQFYDSQKMYMEVFNDNRKISLEKCKEEFHLENVKNLHKSDEDAIITMMLVRALCKMKKMTLEQFLENCTTAKGESNDNEIGYCTENFDDFIKAISSNARDIGNKKRKHFIRLFAETVKAKDNVCDNELKGKRICFSTIFEYNETILCLKLIWLIINQGGIYDTKVSNNQFYVKDDEDDAENVKSRYHHVVYVMKNNPNIQTISYDDLLKMLKVTWEDLEKIDLPKLSIKYENKSKEKCKEKSSLVYSTEVQTTVTMKDVFEAKGLKFDTEQQ